MNINKISPVKPNQFKNISRAQNPINFSTNFDTISFSGNKKGKNKNKLMAYLASGALLLTSLLSPTKASASSFEKRIQDYNDLSLAALVEIEDDNKFQLAQTLDAPSITFDLTGNWNTEVIKPITSLAYITKDIETGNDFSNIDDLISSLYPFEINDEYHRNLAALALIQANPWMAQKVTNGLVDFTQGDMSNIDPELIRATDYTTDGEKISILVPEFNPTEETFENSYSTMVSNIELLPKNANEFDETTIYFSEEELNNAQNDEELIALVNEKLAETYGLDTMECYAGDAIWHAIGLTRQNEDLFKYASEVNQRKALASYVEYNGKLQIVCPKVPISIIANENQEQILNPNSFLREERDEAPAISYITSDRTVANLEDLNGIETTPLDILDLYGLTDDVSLKEAYEQNPEKYEALLTSAYRQIIDSNNELLHIYGNRVITKEDLLAPIGYTLYESGITKINLQPLAYAHVDYEPQRLTIIQQATPTAEPTATPTAEPTATPTAEPTATPTAEPTATPTAEPTATPTAEPTATPTAEPTATPTAEPTATPTAEPTATPTAKPTATPTAKPTVTPTPTPHYTLPPITPTDEPIITSPPVATPSANPTATPTAKPTATPTAEPTATPTAEPTATPTAEPTATPTAEPTATPTYCPDIDTDDSSDDKDNNTDDGGADFEDVTNPTAQPTTNPTAQPTQDPTPCPDTGTDDSSDDKDNNTDDGGADFENYISSTTVPSPSLDKSFNAEIKDDSQNDGTKNTNNTEAQFETLNIGGKRRSFTETIMALPIIRLFKKRKIQK